MKGLHLSRVQKMAYAALFMALTVIMNRVVGMAQVGPFFSFARIAPGTSVVLFASVLLGPIYGGFVGVAADALGWVMLGQWTGTFNFFLSIYYFVIGLLPYFVGRFFTGEKTKRIAKTLFLPLLAAIFVSALAATWALPSLSTLFEKASFHMLTARIVLTVIIVIGGAITTVSYFLLRRVNAKMIGGFTVEATFGISLIQEILACLLKPLAFIAFYSLILGQSFTEATGFDYGALLLLTAIFAMVNIPLNAYLLTLYCRRGHFLVRGSIDGKEE